MSEKQLIGRYCNDDHCACHALSLDGLSQILANVKRHRTDLGYDPIAHEQNMQWLKEREAERRNQPPQPIDDSALIRPR